MSEDTNAAGDDEETDSEAIDVERTVTREEAATVLHDLADGVASGTVAFEEGDVTAEVPESLEFELEYEREDDEAEIEAELEWSVEASEQAVDEDVEREDDEFAAGTRKEESAAGTGGDESVAEAEDAETPGDASAVEGLVEPGEEARSRARFELYRDNAGEWRWRLVHHNGNIIADGGEGYNRKRSARNGLESVRRNAPGAAVVERE